jgi:magnesium transporter
MVFDHRPMNHPTHCKQIAHEISLRSKNHRERFLSLSHEDRAEVLLCLSKKSSVSLLSELSEADLTDILEHLDPDQAADIVQLLPHNKQKKIVESLSESIRSQVAFLSEFDPHTAAGIMSLDYIQVDERDTIVDAGKQLKSHEQRTGRFPIMLVMRSGKLVGQLPGHALGLGSPTEPIENFIRSIQTVNADASRQEIVDVFKHDHQNKVAVVSTEGSVLGIVYADSLLRYLEEKAASSLYSLAGIHTEESVLDSAGTKVHFRYKWLILNLATAFFAASVVSLFQETIAAYVLLAVYMPIVAGMGGNAATQTLAVLVRGIALGQIDLKHAWPALRQEILAGFTNGVINGAIVAFIVYLLHQEVLIALILGFAMIVNLVVAGAFGTIVPLLMKRLGKDPATSATIFITTATDVLGFLFFLGLATLLLP